MDWIAVALAGAAGAGAACIALVVVPNSRDRRAAYGITVAVLFTVLATAAHVFLLPPLRGHVAAMTAEEELAAVPPYAVIRTHYPDVWTQMLADMQTGLRAGATHDTLVARAREHLIPLVLARLPHAGDEALLGYIGVTVEEMEVLGSKDPALCMQFLLPHRHGALDVTRHIPEALSRRDLDGLAAVLRTAAGMTVPTPPEADVTQDLVAVVSALQAAHGDDAEVLDQLEDPAVDAAAACTVTADLYRRILALPATRAARLLRFLFA